MTARYIVGNVIDQLDQLPAESVDLLLTSPPFLALRSYLPDDHPDKPNEIGLEGTVGEYIDALLDVVEAAERVLAPHGSMCIELGDTYSGSGGHGGDYDDGGMRDGQPLFAGSARQSRRDGAEVSVRVRDIQRRTPPRRVLRPNGNITHHTPGQTLQQTGGDGWPMDKSLCLVPEIFRFSLVYGFNPLTGRQTYRWRARNVIRWCRPNPPVGALSDKVRPATSDMVIVCQDRSRYFDLDAVRKANPRAAERSMGPRRDSVRGDRDPARGVQNEAGAPPLDHWWIDDTFDQDAWHIATQPYPGAHYATWPEELVVTPIQAMCPHRVCKLCGKPSERIVEQHYERAAGGNSGTRRDAKEPDGNDRMAGPVLIAAHRTIGWSHCACSERCQPTSWKVEVVEVPQGKAASGKWIDLEEWDSDTPPAETRTKTKRKRVLDQLGECNDSDHWRPGVVLDPFAGSGTTLQVATGHGRDAIGIDIDERNAELALARVGPLMLNVEYQPPPPADVAVSADYL